MSTCERCGNAVKKVGKYSSGRFCSRSCANSRVWSDEINERRGKTYLSTIGKVSSSSTCIVCDESYFISRRVKYSINGICSRQCYAKHRFNQLYESAMRGDVKNPKTLKKILIHTAGYKCVWCGNLGIHREVELILHIDHIDGNSDNNVLDNLRFLCPNCHSQTPTFGNKATKNRSKNAHRTNIQQKWRTKSS